MNLKDRINELLDTSFLADEGVELLIDYNPQDVLFLFDAVYIKTEYKGILRRGDLVRLNDSLLYYVSMNGDEICFREVNNGAIKRIPNTIIGDFYRQDFEISEKVFSLLKNRETPKGWVVSLRHSLFSDKIPAFEIHQEVNKGYIVEVVKGIKMMIPNTLKLTTNFIKEDETI